MGVRSGSGTFGPTFITCLFLWQLKRDEGLDFTLGGAFNAGPEEMNAFAAGELDAGYVGEAPAITAIANMKIPVKIVAFVNAEGSAIVVKKEAQVESLAGLKVAVPGYSTVQDFLLSRELESEGIRPEGITRMVMKPPEMLAALKGGDIDAFIAWEPYPSRVSADGYGRTFKRSSEIWPGHPCCVIVASEASLNTPKIGKLLKAHRRAINFISENPGQAAGIGAKYTGFPLDVIISSMKNIKYTDSSDPAYSAEYVGYLVKMGYISVPDPQAFVRNNIFRME
jgi:NitT/TauT family transport system substrate-binding protein